MTAGLDAGLADGYWRRYFTSGEVAEIEQAVRVTGVIYGDVPVHVRVYHRADDAPTILAPHGLIVYGFLCARLHLAFWRAGYNVVSWDLPGFGQSGGPRHGPTIGGMIDALAPDDRLGGGAVRRRPGLRRRPRRGRRHRLLRVREQPEGARDLAPPPARVRRHRERRLGQPGLAPAPPGLRDRRDREDRARGRRFDAEKSVPWETIFSSEEDQAAYALYREDPLRIKRYNVHLARDLFRKRKPPVSFEDCRTPVQLITSEENGIWPPSINDRALRAPRVREGARPARGLGPVGGLA